MAHQPGVGLLIVGLHMVFLHKCQDFLQDRLIFLCPQSAVHVRQGDDLVGPAGVESCCQMSFPVSANRILGFIAVAEGLVHADDPLLSGVQHLFWHCAEPQKVVLHLALFKGKLLPVIHLLDLAAAASSGLLAPCILTGG